MDDMLCAKSSPLDVGLESRSSELPMDLSQCIRISSQQQRHKASTAYVLRIALWYVFFLWLFTKRELPGVIPVYINAHRNGLVKKQYRVNKKIIPAPK